MKIFSLLLLLIFFNISSNAEVFPIPEDNEVNFDVVRKNKIIGNLNIKFINDKENLILHSILDIEVKILFIPAYKFFQETKETWMNGKFISIDGFTDFVSCFCFRFICHRIFQIQYELVAIHGLSFI